MSLLAPQQDGISNTVGPSHEQSRAGIRATGNPGGKREVGTPNPKVQTAYGSETLLLLSL